MNPEDQLNGSHYYIAIFGKFLIYIVIGFFGGQLASSLIYIHFFGEDIELYGQALLHPDRYLQLGMPLLLIQGSFSLVCFLIAPLLFANRVNFPIHYNFWDNHPTIRINSFASVLFIMIFALPVSNILAEWNHALVFPSFLSGFEQWARSSEEQLHAMTKLITHFNSFQEFLVGILIVGVLAAVGEELLFRGLFQPFCIALTKNKHLGIILTAFVFAAIHMQFLSFLPRFALGILLGYFYLYSQNLWIPIFAHFVNNSVSLFFVYYYGFEASPSESLEQSPFLTSLIASGIIAFIFLQLKKVWAKNQLSTHGK